MTLCVFVRESYEDYPDRYTIFSDILLTDKNAGTSSMPLPGWPRLEDYDEIGVRGLAQKSILLDEDSVFQWCGMYRIAMHVLGKIRSIIKEGKEVENKVREIIEGYGEGDGIALLFFRRAGIGRKAILIHVNFKCAKIEEGFEVFYAGTGDFTLENEALPKLSNSTDVKNREEKIVTSLCGVIAISQIDKSQPYYKYGGFFELILTRGGKLYKPSINYRNVYRDGLEFRLGHIHLFSYYTQKELVLVDYDRIENLLDVFIVPESGEFHRPRSIKFEEVSPDVYVDTVIDVDFVDDHNVITKEYSEAQIISSLFMEERVFYTYNENGFYWVFPKHQKYLEYLRSLFQ